MTKFISEGKRAEEKGSVQRWVTRLELVPDKVKESLLGQTVSVKEVTR